MFAEMKFLIKATNKTKIIHFELYLVYIFILVTFVFSLDLYHSFPLFFTVTVLCWDIFIGRDVVVFTKKNASLNKQVHIAMSSAERP